MAAAKKRAKKAVRRRPSATRRGSKKGLPKWALIGAGLLAGVVIVLLVQFVIDRTGQPDSGLRNLVKRAQQPKPQPRPKVAKKPVKKPAAKPKYDFYTILTESETVIPDSVETRQIKAEKNVSYVLQVGSFSAFADADTLKAKLAFSGLVAHIQKIDVKDKGTFHRVRLGPYSDPQTLDETHRKLKKLAIPSLRLKVKG